MLNQILKHLQNSANILVIDDNIALQSMLKKMLQSSLATIHSAPTMNSAHNLIKQSKTDWHCWIVDIDLGMGYSGLSIFKDYTYFPYKIVLSGLQKMNVSFEATKMGALGVFDKSPDYMTNDIFLNISGRNFIRQSIIILPTI